MIFFFKLILQSNILCYQIVLLPFINFFLQYSIAIYSYLTSLHTYILINTNNNKKVKKNAYCTKY